MSLLLNFAIGFLAALMGVIPPGLLNMSAAKISMKEGRKRGILFSIGVCVTVMIQAYVALVFAKYLDGHPDIVDMLQKVALGIFICISIYFFFIAKDQGREIPKPHVKSKTSRFFYGMFLGALNLLPLPYWVYISITFATFGWFSFDQPDLLVAVIASGIGTFTMLGIYVQFFRRKEEDTRKRKFNINYFIGFITAVISVITFVKILRDI
jgi:threonine/homoserine/homoserine lactone efflux protein